MKLFPKTVQGSDDDNEAKESQEINEEMIANKRYADKQPLRA